jgi:hypothetical protein
MDRRTYRRAETGEQAHVSACPVGGPAASRGGRSPCHVLTASRCPWPASRPCNGSRPARTRARVTASGCGHCGRRDRRGGRAAALLCWRGRCRGGRCGRCRCCWRRCERWTDRGGIRRRAAEPSERVTQDRQDDHHGHDDGDGALAHGAAPDVVREGTLAWPAACRHRLAPERLARSEPAWCKRGSARRTDATRRDYPGARLLVRCKPAPDTLAQLACEGD